MKTDALIEMLARDAGPAPRALVLRRLSPAVALGLLFSALVAVSWLGVLPATTFATAAPWTKITYAAALAMCAGWLTSRLSKPAAPTRRPRQAVLAVAVAMATVGVAALWVTPAEARAQALFGESWLSCPWRVLALSLPALAAALWAVRGLAPTRPAFAGFAAGLLAGSLGAFGYALSCPESSAAFVAVWYSLGILLTGLLGAALGQRLLRW
jgi:hypothetical protein